MDFISRWLVLEPMMLLETLTFGAYVTQQNMYKDKINQTHQNSSKEEVERITTTFFRNCSIIETLLTVLVMLVAGILSDKVGRKNPLLWNLSWNFLSLSSLLAINRLDNGEIDLTYYYIPSLLYGISGGAFNYFLLSFSYLGDLINSDESEKSTRLVRFTTTETSITVGTVLGYLICRTITQHSEAYNVFIFTLACFGVSIVYCALRIQNIVPSNVERPGSWKERLIQTATILTQRREGHARLVIVSFCLLFILQEAPRGFDNVLQVLYIGQKFDWSSEQLLGLKAVTAASSAVGQFLLFPILVRCLHVPLALVGIMTVVSRVSHYLLLGLAPAHQDYLLYLSAGANCLQGVQAIIIRSSLAKELPSHQLGTVFAVNEITVSLLPLLTSPLASAVYNATNCQGCLQVTNIKSFNLLK